MKEKLMGVQQTLLYPDTQTLSVLRYLCEQSGKLYNSGIYFSRQYFLKNGKILSGKFDLDRQPSVSKTLIAQSLPSTPAQQTLRSVTEAFKSFKSLRAAFKQGKINRKPSLPGYLKGAKLFKVSYPNSGGQKPKIVNGKLRFSLGFSVRRWFGLDSFELPIPSNLDLEKVREFTILPKNGSFYLECSYEIRPEIHDLDPSLALGIDLGTAENLVAAVDTLGNSFLINARELKSMNQLWNKRVATRKEDKPQGYWDSWLDRVTRKRNHQMRDGINKAAKATVLHCLEHGIGTIVIGWNEGFKTSSNMGRVQNQKFVQIPLAKLRDRIMQLCEKFGIRFIVTEEAYTSKASFLDGDSLPKFGEKPDGWKASGKRILRGLFRTAKGWLINADLNGGANIIRKVAANLDIDLGKVGRRCLTSVTKLWLWETKLTCK